MKNLSILFILMSIAICAIAQPPSDSSPYYPQGATYTLSNGSTTTLSSQSLSCSTQYYNVIQVSNGTLNLNGCTFTKTGDGSSGDNSSFYGNNSVVYAGSASSSGYSSTSSATGAIINITNCTISSASQGANAVFATSGATINVNGVVINNANSVSRGLHCTYGGTIIASNVDITTQSETSSTIATDRGGGTVTVTGGTATAQGNNSAVLYSTGTITANNLTGVSQLGEIAVVEGDNGVIINGCTMTSGSSNRGLMMLQSGSGDAQGSNAYITVTNSSLTTTDDDVPLCEVPTLNTGTLTLTDATLSVASGMLMYVNYNTQWSTYGGTGNLILQTTEDSWNYTGNVDADSYSNVTVTVDSNVTWNGTIDNDNNASSTKVTINATGVWVLTANAYVDTLINNGTIVTNGYTLTANITSGSGTLTDTQSGSSYTVSECDTYTWNGTTYTTSGTYYYNGDTLILTINSASPTTTTVTETSSYTWNGSTYTTSGTYTYSHTDNNGCTQVDTLYLTINTQLGTDTTSVVYDTITVYDTNSVTLYDTIIITLYDTSNITVYDTSSITVYDTSSITVYDTSSITVYDTSNITVYDTSNIIVYDTNIITMYDTTSITIYDTSNVTLYDTTSITIYDTISLAIHDTTIITLYDTTYLYDTTIITNTVYDTTIITQYDTTYINNYIHDTTVVTNTVYDTTIITQYDTTYINNYIHDTTIVTNTVYDTTIITQYDTTYINNYIHDTTIVTNTVYDTTIITQYDTTYINNYIHDTTIVTNTVYDTTYITQYDTTYINLYIYDTITITDTITIPLETYNLSVISSNTQQGVAAGNGEFPEGTEVEIAAIPLEGHTFVSWSDGVIENPRTITLTCDSTFTATFGTVGTESTLPYSFQIYAHHDVIVVENANGNRIRIFDAVGRILATQMAASSTFQYQVPSSGVYLIQVGNYPARKLTIVR